METGFFVSLHPESVCFIPVFALVSCHKEQNEASTEQEYRSKAGENCCTQPP
jgi:hypothetical protein